MRGLVAIVVFAPLVLAAASPPTWGPRWAISIDDYPPSAFRARREGTARFEVAVDETGAPAKCTIIKSSGHQKLDDRTCELVMKRAKFKPARDDAGNAVPGTFRHLVLWHVASTPQSLPAYAGYGVTVAFDSAGAVTSCKVASLVTGYELTPGQAGKCESMGNAGVFSELLGRPTAGLETATYRFWLHDRRFGGQLPTDQPVRSLRAHVVFDLADDGAITWCEIVLPPPTPTAGVANPDFCGPKAYGVTRAGGGGQANDMFIDVIAAPTRSGA
ncbi:MAG: energy transducer TonB [Sandarakinorhabdus sp.]|nr:energy transducer TonB [Sandarakinorhabdus sp.]